MMQTFECPECRQVFEAEQSAADATVTCPFCQRLVSVPAADLPVGFVPPPVVLDPDRLPGAANPVDGDSADDPDELRLAPGVDQPQQSRSIKDYVKLSCPVCFTQLKLEREEVADRESVACPDCFTEIPVKR